MRYNHNWDVYSPYAEEDGQLHFWFWTYRKDRWGRIPRGLTFEFWA